MARRKTEVFSLSFLDVIACGFGAIVLFYTILSAQAGVQRQERNDDIQAEVDLLEERVLEGYKDLVVLRNALDETQEQTPASDAAARIIKEMERLKEQLALADKETLSRRETIEKLKEGSGYADLVLDLTVLVAEFESLPPEFCGPGSPVNCP